LGERKDSLDEFRVGVLMKDSDSFIICREGWPIILFSLVMAILLFCISSVRWLATVPFLFMLFSIYFFRNPKRVINAGQSLILAPSDGKVLSVDVVEEDKYLKCKAIQVRIFMSLFDVHVNRIPVSGIVEWTKKTGGIYLPAYKAESSDKNVRNYTGIKSAYGRILVVQVTGLIARRIVSWIKPGDRVTAGERFGLIRFGSCTELYLPPRAKIEVVPGQKVIGGETIIGRFDNSNIS
jgi:phosphatidylserine decarboxylase